VHLDRAVFSLQPSYGVVNGSVSASEKIVAIHDGRNGRPLAAVEHEAAEHDALCLIGPIRSRFIL